MSQDDVYKEYLFGFSAGLMDDREYLHSLFYGKKELEGVVAGAMGMREGAFLRARGAVVSSAPLFMLKETLILSVKAYLDATKK